MKIIENRFLRLNISVGIAFLSVLVLLVLVGGTFVRAATPKIIVNEFYRSGDLNTTNEWIEVLLIEDLTAAELNGFFVGDSTSSTAAKFSGYQFTNMGNIASTFPKGTIIVIGGDTALTEDTSYDPGNDDWNILLRTNGSHLTSNGSTGNLAGTDVVYIDTDGTNGNTTISMDGFAVNWDSSPGTLGANANVTIAAPANDTGVALTSDLAGASTTSNWTINIVIGSTTLGQPNGGDNTTYIDFLRGGNANTNLFISKTASPNTNIVYHSAVTYTIMLTSGTGFSDTSVLMTDTLPNEVTFSHWVISPTNAMQSGNNISWTGAISDNETLTFSFVADHTGGYGETVTNTAYFSNSTIGDTGPVTFTVEGGSGDITFVYHDLEDVVQVGDLLYLAGDFNGWDANSISMTTNATLDVFTATVPAISQGFHEYKYVVDDGSKQWDWLNTDNRSYIVNGNATVNNYRNVVIDWANLQAPPTLNTEIDLTTNPVYGQVFINNVTNPVGEGRGLVAEVGYGDDPNPANWAWFPMTYNVDNGNNDEFGGVMMPSMAGVYSYATRFDGNAGVGNPNANWIYGDLDGLSSGGFTLDQTGVMTVAEGKLLTISKWVMPSMLDMPGHLVTYTIQLAHEGDIDDPLVLLTDTLPSDTTFAYWVVSPTNTSLNSNEITWSGPLAVNDVVTFTFAAMHTGDYGDVVTNTVWFSGSTKIGFDTATFMVANEPFSGTILINEADADMGGTENTEFIELYDGGVGNTPLDGLVVVLFNGSDDQSYEPEFGVLSAFDLDSYTTDANGYFLIGGTGIVDADITVNPDFWLQNGADAVALYQGNASDFPNDTPVTTVNLIDALVYGTADPDDVGLLPLLNAGQPQADEDGKFNKDIQSNQRCPNGSGGVRNTDTYNQFAPTPGVENSCKETDLSLALSVDNINPDEGETITYTVSVMNSSSSTDEATNVVVTSYLPDTTSEISNVVSSCGAVVGGNTLTWTVGTVVTGGMVSCEINTTIRPGTNGSNLTTYAEIFAADQNDPDSTPGNFAPPPTEDDEAEASIFVGALAVCSDPYTATYQIQGNGDTSPLLGQNISVQGAVVGDFQSTLNGFYLQDVTGDGDSATSDGIFIYAPGSIDLTVGDVVRVDGEVAEFNEVTEISNVTAIYPCGSDVINPTPVDLPVPDSLEPYEGMLVIFPEDLTASQNYFQGRYGQVTLSSDGRMFNPTNVYTPASPEAIALAEENMRRMLILDDGTTSQNPDPIPYIGLNNTLRAGDTIANLTGVIDFGPISSNSSLTHYRLQPTESVTFTRINDRTPQPDDVGGSLKVASFNVLNYFTTLDLGPAICGPSGNLGCRGADSQEEFDRQHAKIITALVAINADVVGLIEIENNTSASLQSLVDALNDVFGPGTYDYINTGTIGDDAIKVAFIYKTISVTPVGDYAILDSTFDPDYLDDKNRPALAQTFEENSNGEQFTAVVNHLKSKGSACDDVGDPDTGDGQGNCNLTRTKAMEVELAWLATDPTGSGDPDFLIMGDLNAYAMEDPIMAALTGGYTDLAHAFIGSEAYSFVFDGWSGYLDHALANPDLLAQVSDVTEWHINTDEPSVIDYNTEFKPQDLYEPHAYRASDHDPVVVGLNLGNTAPTVDLDKMVTTSDGVTTSVPLGDVVTYTLSIANDGPIPAMGVMLTDTLPTGVTFNAWLNQGSAQLPAADTITWGPYNLDVGESYTLSFSVLVTTDVTFGNVTIVNIADFTSMDGASGSAEAAFTIAPDTSETYTVTFIYYDLEDVIQAGETVYVAGNFNGWDSAANPLIGDVTGEVFSTTVSGILAGQLDYKYIVNDGSEQWDWLNTNDRSTIVAGDTTLEDYRNVAVDWANLQGPASLTIELGQTTSVISGQVYINNVTTPAGEGRAIMAELGYGMDSTPTTWAWSSMSYLSDVGNNDVFGGDVTPASTGVYSYATRFDGNWGTGNPNAGWTYGDLDGIPFSADQAGVLTVTEVVTGGNTAPVAVDDAYATGQDVTLVVSVSQGILNNDTDADGDTLSAVLESGPSNGSLNLSSDGSFVYIPTASFTGTDSFTYHANDGIDDSNIATVVITVSSEITVSNNAPIANSDSYTTSQDTTLAVVVSEGVLANDTDADGDPLSVVLNSSPSNGAVALSSDGSFIYTPTTSFTGTDSFTYYANDGTDDSNTATVTISVTPSTTPTVRGVTLVAPTDALTDTPGTTVVYTVLITNTGDANDTFDLVLSGESWSSTAATSVGPLAPAAGSSLNVSVTIPATATNGLSDSVTLTATSQGDGSTNANVTLTTTANVVSTDYILYIPLLMK